MQVTKTTFLSVSPKGRNVDIDGSTVLKLILKNEDVASREMNWSAQIFALCVQHTAGIFLCGMTTSSAQKVRSTMQSGSIRRLFTHTHTHTKSISYRATGMYTCWHCCHCRIGCFYITNWSVCLTYLIKDILLSLLYLCVFSKCTCRPWDCLWKYI
jgi:hypothetical protein